MKMKKIESIDEMLEYLIGYAYAMMMEERDYLMEEIEDMSEFRRANIYGRHQAFEDIKEHMRGLQKHGYEHLLVDDYGVDEE